MTQMTIYSGWRITIVNRATVNFWCRLIKNIVAMRPIYNERIIISICSAPVMLSTQRKLTCLQKCVCVRIFHIYNHILSEFVFCLFHDPLCVCFFVVVFSKPMKPSPIPWINDNFRSFFNGQTEYLQWNGTQMLYAKYGFGCHVEQKTKSSWNTFYCPVMV